MVDGASLLAQLVWGLRGQRLWSDRPDSNLLDGHAPFYDTYRCADGRYVAVGALEPQFYAALLAVLGLDPGDAAGAAGPVRLARPAGPVRARCSPPAPATSGPRRSAGTDACVTPVLAFGEVAEHPQLAARATIVAPDGVAQAAPAPRFSRTATELPAPPRPAEPVDRRPRRLAAPLTPSPTCANGTLERWFARKCRSRRSGVGQAEVSSTSRLRVRFGSTGMPGPMVVATVIFLMYRPLAADGLARRISSSAAP